MPVQGLDVERGQILLHHAVAVSTSEIDQAHALQEQVVSRAFEAHDLPDQSVTICIVTPRILILVDIVRYTRCVHE